MIQKLISRALVFLGLKKPKVKTYFHEQAIHFVPDSKYEPIKFMSIEEAVASGIDVEADVKKYGMRPVYYRNGKPEFIFDLKSDPGFPGAFLTNDELKKETE